MPNPERYTSDMRADSLSSKISFVVLFVLCFAPLSALAAPTAVDDTYSTVFGMSNPALTTPAPGVLGNDSDPNSVGLVAALQTSSSTINGILNFKADGSFTYFPYFVEPLITTYYAVSSQGKRTLANFVINVTEDNTTLDISTTSTSQSRAATGTVVNIYSGSGNDTIVGSSTAAGILNGGAGNDLIQGGSGGDIIIGGLGTDRFIGNGGANVYVFRPGFGADTFFDFSPTIDILDLRGLGLTSVSKFLAKCDTGPNAVCRITSTDTITFTSITKSQLATMGSRIWLDPPQTHFLLTQGTLRFLGGLIRIR